METEITAKARLFPDVGPGIKAMKHDAAGRYYFLSTMDHTVRIYTADNTYLGQIPKNDQGPAGIVYGEDFAVDASGRLYVADRGANAVKVYTRDGSLAFSIPVATPISVVALPSGDIAVASLGSARLVTIYDKNGKDLREFGDFSDLADHESLNRLLNVGRLATDPANHIYYAFTYLPEPTVRKYDAFGYASYEISLATIDMYPSAQAMRRDIARLDAQDTPPVLPKIINAIGVDPATQEVWLALGDELMKFDKDGNRSEEYRTLMPSGEDLNATAILIEPHRILLADDPHGVFEFARPDLRKAPTPKTN
ncbi:MAG TPA: hypothetical protein VGR81_10285 [Candidatus Acidoferrales bacterium]|nr:hypothetical protein [Candidatus Acidoferrales bacterium]